MATVSFKNHHIVLEVEKGTKLSECIRRAKLYLETPCSCMGLCGKCKVKVYGEVNEPSKEELEFIKGSSDTRLACLALVKGDIEIELIEKITELKTLNKGYVKEVAVDSEIKKITIPEIDSSSKRSYIDLIDKQVESLELLGKISNLKQNDDNMTHGVMYNRMLLDIIKRHQEVLGVALDIGTTGLSAYLVDLENGIILNKVSALNPQTEYGGDVLTRVSFANTEENGTEILRDCIITKVNEIIRELTGEKYSIQNIYRIVVAANTTMLHLFAGVNPKSIATAPYRAVFLNKLDLKAADFRITINKEGIVTLLPSASSYVGADILAGIAATEFYKKEKSSIFIDIGTNGEIVVVSDGYLAATSTAAGPALEGMNISYGMRAEDGAIDSFSIDNEYNIVYTTIGNSAPIGICGSGLLDIAAQLVEKGILQASGRFNNIMDNKLKERIVDKKFYISENIYISQKDIRQIQLAKGAISTGISMLLEELHISIEDISEVVIAGAFGYHVNAESIKKIGLIPKGFKGTTYFVGNSSVEGARQALINKFVMNDIIMLKDKMRIVELSTKDNFQEYFVQALSF